MRFSSYWLVDDLSAISFAICSFVFPSVVMPRLLAATISGSVTGCAVATPLETVEAVEVAGGDVDASFAAFSNSFLASPIDFASSGSFWGPHRKTTSRIPTTMSHSYPTSANPFHISTHVSCFI